MHLPDAYVIVQGSELVDFITASDDLDSILREVTRSDLRTGYVNFVSSTALGGRHPLEVIRTALTKFPDEIPSPAARGLDFIKDEEVRAGLRLDISAVHDAIFGDNWKAATVLGGAVVEALLLWRLQQCKTKAESAMAAKTKGALLNWGLETLSAVGAELKLIGIDTLSQVSLARNARNLIHPGRMLRDRAECHRGTAYAAVAAIDYVVRDFERPGGA
jgi:hypothetical protein